ncbi:FAD dependent oxidoreductase [Mycena amicta]|nr:FAD dependent oxidoreductase [Mycena amicta]
MGSVLSLLQLTYKTVKSLVDSYWALAAGVARDPGVPIPNPSASYWCYPKSPLDSTPRAELPENADIVIIGSGITGTAVARAMLRASTGRSLRVVMLEAREVCSGATGRNGGHISPNTYTEYEDLEKQFGNAIAKDIIRYRLEHFSALLGVATEEDLLEESQARKVQQYDVYFHQRAFQRAKEGVAKLLKAMPEREGKHSIADDSALKDIHLRPSACGYVSQPGGALHPYRLVTGVLQRLLNTYSDNDPSTSSFRLFTKTPCTSVALSNDKTRYILSTPRGTIQALHVVHATNAWAAHLLPGMRRKIVPFGAHMTAHHPRAVPADLALSGDKAFVFYPGTSSVAFDYLTQQQSGELMFGGGALLGGLSEEAFVNNLGTTDDSAEGEDFVVSAYLCGALGRYFAQPINPDTPPSTYSYSSSERNPVPLGESAPWSWSGIIGLSADGQPWVGRVPKRISGRPAPTPMLQSHPLGLAQPGEWIAAGFSGEGMTHAWLAGEALARMILGEQAENGTVGGEKRHEGDDPKPEPAHMLPSPFLITEKRWKTADIESFFASWE